MFTHEVDTDGGWCNDRMNGDLSMYKTQLLDWGIRRMRPCPARGSFPRCWPDPYVLKNSELYPPAYALPPGQPRTMDINPFLTMRKELVNAFWGIRAASQ